MTIEIIHGTDGTEGSVIARAPNFVEAKKEIVRILGTNKIPVLTRSSGTLMFCFIRNQRSEWIKAKKVLPPPQAKKIKPLSGTIVPHKDYDIFV